MEVHFYVDKAGVHLRIIFQEKLNDEHDLKNLL